MTAFLVMTCQVCFFVLYEYSLYICVTRALYIYAVYLLTPVVLTAMPATRRSSDNEPSSAAPYSLSGASKPQLTALTVAALKSHLKHFKLSPAGKKSELVDRLHSYLHADSITDSQVTDSQLDAPPQDGPVNARTDSEPQQIAQHQIVDNVQIPPQQLLDQLTTILQQARNSRYKWSRNTCTQGHHNRTL